MAETKTIKQRNMEANYLNIGTAAEAEYALLGVGVKSLTETPAAQVKSKKYICSKSNTKSISAYDWSTPFEIDQIKDEQAIEFICNIGKMQLVGADAESSYVIVDLYKPVPSKESVFEARYFDIAIEVASFPEEENDMGGSGNFLAKGDPVIGEFDIKTCTFTKKGEAVQS